MSGQKRQGNGDSATVMFSTDDPRINRFQLASAPERLQPLQARLTRCTVVDDSAGVNYENFVKNIRGVAPLSVKGHKLMLVRTRSTIFLLSKALPESLYEVTPALMRVDLRRRAVLQADDGKRLYLINISSDECAVMMNLADKDNEATKADRLKPGEGTVVDLEAFRSKLAASKAATFDAASFSRSVKFVAIFQDGEDRSYYFIIAGQDENPYRLYVDEPVHREGAVYLDHGSERCILMAER